MSRFGEEMNRFWQELTKTEQMNPKVAELEKNWEQSEKV